MAIPLFEPNYLGGTEETQAARQQQYGQGLAQGGATMQQGIGYATNWGGNALGAAQSATEADRVRAQDYARAGAGIGDFSLDRQRALTSAAVQTAGDRVDSAALLQMQQGMAQANAAAMARAASARGGNQAASMRGAAADAAVANQNIVANSAILRAQEDAAQKARLVAAQQAAAQTYGQQMAMGYGMQQQGLGMSLGAGGQLAGIGGQQSSLGLGIGQLGTQSQGQFLGAQTATDQAILEEQNRRDAAKAEFIGGMVGGGMSAVSSMYGGGGG